jgi:hypothetical protein
MTQYPNLAEIEGRPGRSWNMDGLQELMMGVLWMTWGGAFLLGELLPKNWVRGVYWTLVPALLALSGFGGNWLVKRLKARITFPRTGYLELKEPSRAVRFGTAALAITMAAALAAVIVRMDGKGVEHLITPVVGVIVSLSFLVVSVKQKAPHYLVLAGVALALGIAFGVLRTGWESLNWMFVVLGAVAAISGGNRVRRFVEKYGTAPKEA